MPLFLAPNLSCGFIRQISHRFIGEVDRRGRFWLPLVKWLAERYQIALKVCMHSCISDN